MLEPLLYKGDSRDKARARAKQSSFRESMGCGFDPNHRLGKYGAFLLPDDARDGKNFYEGFRQEILDAIKERYPANVKHRLYNPQGLFSNMLRSEHIIPRDFSPICFAASISPGISSSRCVLPLLPWSVRQRL